MIGAFVGVWNDLLTWFVGIFAQITTIFVDTSGASPTLTFVGVCAVIMAGVALILLAKMYGPCKCELAKQTALIAGNS